MRELPLTSDGVADAVVWLLEAKVPSFSPETSVLLLNISRAIEEGLKSVAVTDGARDFLTAYAKLLCAVSVVGHLHQGAVIKELELLVGRK